MEEEETPEWMNYGDDQILELLRSEDVFAPDHVAEEVPLPSPDVAHRCRVLVDHGLLTKHAIGMYEVTDLGDRFLDGEIDPMDLAETDGEGGDDVESKAEGGTDE